MDSSYYNDVLTGREPYSNDSICLIAEEKGKIVGLIDAEIEKEKDDLCVSGKERGSMIWHLAVLPEYRRQDIATKLWHELSKQLLDCGVKYCEVWTQEDEPTNRWY